MTELYRSLNANSHWIAFAFWSGTQQFRNFYSEFRMDLNYSIRNIERTILILNIFVGHSTIDKWSFTQLTTVWNWACFKLYGKNVDVFFFPKFPTCFQPLFQKRKKNDEFSMVSSWNSSICQMIHSTMYSGILACGSVKYSTKTKHRIFKQFFC